MTRIRYTLNKNSLTKAQARKFDFNGFEATCDTLFEEVYNENGERVSATEWYIFKPTKKAWTPYATCVQHGERYVIARWTRFDSVNTKLTDYAIDCDELGRDDRHFETMHFGLRKGCGKIS